MAILKTKTDIKVLRELYKKVAIFTQRGDVIIMRARPDYRNVKWGAGTLAGREGFKVRQKEALKILEDPVVKAEYQARCKKGQQAWQIVFRELIKKSYDLRLTIND